MDINVKVDIPALDRIADLVAAHLAGQPAGNAAAPQPDKPARTAAKDKNTPASATAASEASQEPKGSSQPAPDDQSKAGATDTGDASEAAVDYKDVKKAILDLVAKKGRDAAVELLKKFDATKGEEIDQARWGEFLTAAQVVLDA